MDALSIVVLGCVSSLLTHFIKKYTPNLDPKVLVALIAILGGIGYSFVVPHIPTELIAKIGYAFTTAVAFYEVLLKNLIKQK